MNDLKNNYRVIGLLAVTLIAAGFILGRLTDKAKPGSTVTKSTETITKDQKVTTQIEKKIVKVKEPNGRETTTTTVDTTKEVDIQKQIDKSKEKTVIPATKWNVSAIVSPSWERGPYYGVSVTHQLLGPLTVGALGLSNGMIGFSIGIDF